MAPAYQDPSGPPGCPPPPGAVFDAPPEAPINVTIPTPPADEHAAPPEFSLPEGVSAEMPPIPGSLFEPFAHVDNPDGLSYYERYMKEAEFTCLPWEDAARRKKELKKERKKAMPWDQEPPPRQHEPMAMSKPVGPLAPDAAERPAAQGAALSAMLRRDTTTLRARLAQIRDDDLERRMAELRDEYQDVLKEKRTERKAAQCREWEDCVTKWVEGGLPGDDFDYLREFLRAHPRLLDGASSKLGASFESSRGFVVRFSADSVNEGRSKLRRHAETCGLDLFFDRVAYDCCGAFVLNVLVCAPTGDPKNDDDFAVHWHRDATLGLRTTAAEDRPFAHRVTVLYVDAPGSLEGGQLLVRMPKRPPWRACWRRRQAARRAGGPSDETKRHMVPPIGDDDSDDSYIDVDEKIAPAANRLVEFLGGCEHAVKAFAAPDHEKKLALFGGARVSLVLEQYVVPEALKGDLIDFEIVDAAAYDRGTSPVERTGDDVNWDEVL